MFRAILPPWKFLASCRHSFDIFTIWLLVSFCYSRPYSSNCPVPVAVDNGIARRTSRVPQCHSPILLHSPRDAAPKGPLSPSSREPLSPHSIHTTNGVAWFPSNFLSEGGGGAHGGGDLMGGRAVVDKRIALISKAANLTRSSTVRKSLSSFKKS